jgi:hypothetical protein
MKKFVVLAALAFVLAAGTHATAGTCDSDSLQCEIPESGGTRGGA